MSPKPCCDVNHATPGVGLDLIKSGPSLISVFTLDQPWLKPDQVRIWTG